MRYVGAYRQPGVPEDVQSALVPQVTPFRDQPA
jgi:hypothetical protein